MDTTSQGDGGQDAGREATRKSLLAAARRLFAGKGYQDTSSDDIVLAAAVTRGAFYFHFEDKRDIFRALIDAEQGKLAEGMSAVRSDHSLGPYDALYEACGIFLEAASQPDTRRIVFVDGPDVLGRAEWLDLESKGVGQFLRAGLLRAMNAGEIQRLSLSPLAAMLSAVLREAVLSLGAEEASSGLGEVLTILSALFDGLREPLDSEDEDTPLPLE